MKNFVLLFGTGIALTSALFLFTDSNASNKKTLITTVTPTLSTSSVQQGGSTILTFTANEDLANATKFIVNSSTLLSLMHTPKSCVITKGSKRCSITITTDKTTNPVAHTLHVLEKSDSQLRKVNLTRKSLTLHVNGSLALSADINPNQINKGLSAKVITVTNMGTKVVQLSKASITDMNNPNIHVAGFEIYNGTNSVGNWCKKNCSDSCIVNGNRMSSLTPKESCELYIRAKKVADATIGKPINAHLNISANNGDSTEIRIQSKPELIIGGYFRFTGGNEPKPLNRLAMWDGSKWSPLIDQKNEVNGTNASVQALAVDDRGDVYIGGNFTNAGGEKVNHITKWDGKDFSPLISHGKTGVDGNVYALIFEHRSDKLYIGGDFDRTGTTDDGMTVNNIVEWDGDNWLPLSNDGKIGVNGTVRAFAEDYSDDIYVGGAFDEIGSHDDGMVVNHIAEWNAGNWSALIDKNNGENGLDDNVRALAFKYGKLYVGGQFIRTGTDGSGDVVNHIVQWDDNEWSGFSDDGKTGVNRRVLALDTDLFNNLYIGGNFINAGTTGSEGPLFFHIVKWDNYKDKWSSFTSDDSTGVSGGVSAIKINDFNSTMYLGGHFEHVGAGNTGERVNYVVEWTGYKGWSSLSDGVDNEVKAIIIVNKFSDSLQ